MNLEVNFKNLSHNQLMSLIEETFDGSKDYKSRLTDITKVYHSNSGNLDLILDNTSIELHVKVELNEDTIGDPYFELNFNQGINEANRFIKDFKQAIASLEN